MELLEICQNACDEIGLDKPDTIIGNTDDTAVRALRAAARTGSILAKQAWHELIKTNAFSTSASEPQYDLPSDYRSMVENTAWNQTTDKQIFIISPQLWSYEKSVTTATFDDRFRLLGDDAGPSTGARFTLHPTPSGTETIFYQYYSKNWVTNDSTEKASLTADTDEVVFDDDLFEMGVVWRLLKALGQPYGEEKADFDRQNEICLAQSGATENLHADGNIPALSNIPETGFG